MRVKDFRGSRTRPYGIYYWNPDRHQKTFTTKSEREAFRRELYSAPEVAAGGDETFGSYATRWIDQYAATKAPNTTFGYRSLMRAYLLPAIGDVPIKDITAQMLKKLLLEDIPSESAASNAKRLICAVLNEALDKDRIVTFNAAKGIKMPYNRRGSRVNVIPVTGKQLQIIADTMPDEWALSIWIGYGVGFRPGEILAVRADSLREHDTMLRTEAQVQMRYIKNGPRVVPMKARTSGEFRDVPCPRWLAEKIHKHIADFGIEPDGYLFPSLVESGDTNKQWRESFNAGRNRAGLPVKFIPYQLRHHFASVSLANGVAMPDLARWMGHKRIQTTYDNYAHLMPQSIDSARDASDKAFARLMAEDE